MNIRSHFALSVTLFTIAIAFACGGGGAVVIPDTPDATINAVAKNLAEGRPEVIWKALPPSYQNDITEITHAFADKMDPELYNKVFTILNKAVTVLTNKKAIILDSSMLSMAGEERATIEDGWDTAMAFLGTLLTSEISDLEKMKTFDYESFVKGTGTALMEQAAAMSAKNPEDPYANEFKAKFEAMSVELKTSEGDHATVVVSVPDEEPEEIEMIRVEGRWIPKDMADDWAADIADAKKKIEEITPETMAQGKMQAMMMLAMAETFIDQIGQVNSSEELDALISGMFGGMMGGMGGMGGMGTTPPADDAPSDTPSEEPSDG